MNIGKAFRQRAFTHAQEEQFIRQGFVKLECAFPRVIAEQCRTALWRECGCDPEDPRTWNDPVIRIGDRAEEPFRLAANTAVLLSAFDQLVGAGRWLPRKSLGSFPIRFPHDEDPGDTGWHVDASYPPDTQSATYFDWRINVESRDRALLMLFLFSDVGEQDAPTRIRIGSHLRVARLLAGEGSNGMSFTELAQALEGVTDDLPETNAAGTAGTVYLCHPFLQHAAQRHRGTTPRFMAQPPLHPRLPLDLHRSDGDYSPVERAILLALDKDAQQS